MLNKVNELAGVLSKILPMRPDFQSKLDKKFRLEFNYNSNHIEGNTLTYAETELLLIFDKTNGHNFREYEEMKAHDVALALIKEWSLDKERPLTEANIKNLNEIILVKPFWKDAVTADGQKTRKLVKVGDYKTSPNSVLLSNGEKFEYASVIDTPILMSELVKWYRDEEQKKELHPVEIAALLHYKFVRIHPFDDGNGRIARLLMNYVLFKNNLPPIVIKSADKQNYLSALNKADVGNITAFIDYITQQLEWSLNISIKAAQGENIEEPDDWEKEISLMKKTIDIVSQENIKNIELMKAAWNFSLKPLIDKYLTKFSHLEKLFDRKKIIVSCPETVGISSIQQLNELFNSNKKDIEEISPIRIFYDFKDMQKLHLDIRSNIIIAFEVTEYVVSIDGNQIRKKYNQIIDSAEIDDVLKNIAEDFLQKIKMEVERAN